MSLAAALLSTNNIWRYANMDYLFYSGLKNTAIKSMVISYDIACQWSINFHTRMKTCFPAAWPINNRSSDVQLRFLVPKFHLPAHINKCHQDFSFNYAPHVGRTEGEAPERGWSKINALSYSTKEMGPGSRQDTIEDHFNDMNWKKVIGMGMLHNLLLPNTHPLMHRIIPCAEVESRKSRKGDTTSSLEPIYRSFGTRPSLHLVA